MAGLRAAADAGQPDAGARLIAHWPIALPQAAIIGGYVRFRSEIDPAPLMAWLAAHGARLALPRIEGEAGLVFRAYAPGDRLEKSQFGVLEPRAAAQRLVPSMLLAPLLGFDRAGHRLGYGQGHYDRALEGLRARGAVCAIGLAFAEQEVSALPAEAHDQRLDWVLTPTGAIRCA
jgi:5-formyltetrahydrofolate cyclo-ligase